MRLPLFVEKHKPYLSVLSSVAAVVAGVLAFIEWLSALFQAIQDGNFFGFVVVLLLQSLIVALAFVILFAVFYALLFLVTVVPYLLWRGLTTPTTTFDPKRHYRPGGGVDYFDVDAEMEAMKERVKKNKLADREEK